VNPGRDPDEVELVELACGEDEVVVDEPVEGGDVGGIELVLVMLEVVLVLWMLVGLVLPIGGLVLPIV